MNNPQQLDLLSSPTESVPNTPVTCLGLTFASQAERRAYFLELLRQKLQDPTFRAIEGFPIGSDEDILALSDPPYYTVCPNPFLTEIVAEWQQQRAALHASLDLQEESYQREPFAADVSEGKNDPIYNAHSYHTKVPHKAIMRYILHYTEPGDLVFDGFCGTGMTGVAAQLCGDRKAVEELVGPLAKTPYRIGARKAILNDLSPAATFIAYNYNTPVDVTAFEREAKQILHEVEQEYGWMYETWHPHRDDPKRVKGRINYTVWSEVFVCRNCGCELNYFDVAVNKTTFEVRDEFECLTCHAVLTKKELERTSETHFDSALNRIHSLVRYQPVIIAYEYQGQRFEKSPDADDLELLKQIESQQIKDWFPIHEMPEGERKGKDGYHLKGITYLHHFYFQRPLKIFSNLWQKATDPFIRFFVQGSCLGFTKMNRYQPIQYGRVGGSQVNRYFSGTLFVGSLISEVSPTYSMINKLKRLSKLSLPTRFKQSVISCESTTSFSSLMDSSIDYIFVDPPFGNSLHYSELNFFWEAWLHVLTNREPEAVMDNRRNRTINDYQELMSLAFARMFKILKSGRWITVEFHNSSNSVWNSIQEAILRAGFIVADVRTLDKQQSTYKQSIQKLVKQDLVISAYKPTVQFEQQFLSHAGSAEGVWDFVRQHLAQLPRVVPKGAGLETIAERQNYLLFDRMVAYHIQRGVAVPMGAAQFYAGLHQYFVERDGMYFLPEQVAAYDKARLQSDAIEQLAIFVNDEKSAITWLRQQLNEKPHSFQEIQPRFLQELHQARHEELPDLRVLLEENFLQDEAGRWYVPDPNRAEDLEKLRLRALLREFESYKASPKKLKQFRTEAIRAGFAHAWHAKAFATIVEVAQRLPEQVLQEDPDLLMYFDNASLRVE